MKPLAFILSIYILLLALFPCCTVDDCPDEKAETEQAAGHQAGDNDNCGNCSPFFSCEGCASVSVSAESMSFQIISFPVKSVYTEFIAPYIPDIQYEFWQPPKLG